ncbi:hypothetical protein D9M69_655530 [compost metagenome]
MDRAGAALGGVAADVGSGEVEVLADRVHKEGVGWGVDRDRPAVDLESDLHVAVSVKGDGWFSEASWMPPFRTILGKNP